MPDPSPERLDRLGHAIRMQRTRLRLTQLAAASRGGMHRNYVGAIERGEVNPTYLTLLRLAEALDVPLAKLIVEADPPPPSSPIQSGS